MQDEIAQGNGRCDPQHHRVEHTVDRLGVTGVPGPVERPIEVPHVEHRRHACIAERRPQRVQRRVRQRSPVHRRRRHHGQADPVPPEAGDLVGRPVGVPQRNVADAKQAVGVPVEGGHQPAVVRTHVGAQGGKIAGQHLFEEQTEVGEQHRRVDTELLQLGQPCDRVGVGRRHALLVGGRGGRTLLTQQPLRADLLRVIGRWLSTGYSCCPRHVSHGHPSASSSMARASPRRAGSMWSRQAVRDSKRCWSTSRITVTSGKGWSHRSSDASSASGRRRTGPLPPTGQPTGTRAASIQSSGTPTTCRSSSSA